MSERAKLTPRMIQMRAGMVGTTPARVKVDRQGLVTPQAEKEQEDRLWFARGWPLPRLIPFYILSSLSSAQHGMGTHVAALASRTWVVG